MTGWTGGVDHELRAAVADLLDVAFAHPERPGVLPIVQAGDPVLRRAAVPYTGQLGDELPRLIEAMRRTMHAAPGVGLAAPQVGIGLAIAVCEDRGMPGDARERDALPFRVIVNPRYEAMAAPDDPEVPDSGPAGGPHDTRTTVAFFEGCLSVDGWQAVVARPRRVRLTGHDETGEAFDDVLTGWPARIVQHETDHLAGRLYLDVAESRSFTSNENMARFWAQSPDPAPVAAALGFALP